MSPTTTSLGVDPTVTPNGAVNETLNGATVKLLALVAVLAPTVTVIGPVVTPVGTEVVMLVAVLAVTGAAVPLNITMLLAGVGSKFVPVIITVEPMGPEMGVKELIVGDCARALLQQHMKRQKNSKIVFIMYILDKFYIRLIIFFLSSF